MDGSELRLHGKITSVVRLCYQLAAGVNALRMGTASM